MYSKIRFIKVIPYDVLLMNHLFSCFGDIFFSIQFLNNVILGVLPLFDKLNGALFCYSGLASVHEGHECGQTDLH